MAPPPVMIVPAEFDEVRGKVARHDGQILELRSRIDHTTGLIRGVRDELLRAVENVQRSIEAKIDKADHWNETTDVRNMRRELPVLRSKAAKTDEIVHEVKRGARRRLALLAPSIGAVLWALAHLIEAVVTKLH